jgi:hypothetical protein
MIRCDYEATNLSRKGLEKYYRDKEAKYTLSDLLNILR